MGFIVEIMPLDLSAKNIILFYLIIKNYENQNQKIYGAFRCKF